MSDFWYNPEKNHNCKIYSPWSKRLSNLNSTLHLYGVIFQKAFYYFTVVAMIPCMYVCIICMMYPCTFIRFSVPNFHFGFVSGVTSHGLSCEICKFKAHKKCASKALTNCKWTTLASMGKDIIEEPDGVRRNYFL